MNSDAKMRGFISTESSPEKKFSKRGLKINCLAKKTTMRQPSKLTLFLQDEFDNAIQSVGR